MPPPPPHSTEDDDSDNDETETSESPPEPPPKRRAPPKSSSKGKASSAAPQKSGKDPAPTPPPTKNSQPPGPPLDKDGKPIPPPPIIGPDGKEVPRPRDAQGNPLPIYVTPEGKPIFDKRGNAIALKFDKDGRPVPLQQVSGEASGPGAPLPAPAGGIVEKKKVPSWVFWMGVGDIAVSIILLAYLVYDIADAESTSTEGSKDSGQGRISRKLTFIESSQENPASDVDKVKNSRITTIILCLLGGLSASLLMIATNKNQLSFIYFYAALALIIFVVEMCLVFFVVQWYYPAINLALCYFAIRMLVAMGLACLGCDQNQVGVGGGYSNPYGGGIMPNSGYQAQRQGQFYPGQGQQVPTVPAGQQQQFVQQPITTTYVYPTAAVMPYGGMGYGGYGGYPSYGMGFAGGYGMYGGGYGSYPYGGGWGGWGYGGYYDDWW